MRRLFRRQRPQETRESPRDVLVAALENIAATSETHGPDAGQWAELIRRGGKSAAHELVVDTAGHLNRCRSFLSFSPIMQAAVAYEKAVTGVDLAAMPSEHTRARLAGVELDNRLARAQARLDARAEIRRGRQLEQQLALARSNALVPFDYGAPVAIGGSGRPQPAMPALRGEKFVPLIQRDRPAAATHETPRWEQR